MVQTTGARPVVSIDPHARYALPIEVRPEDVDGLGHVNNVIYVRWIQDAAVAHWRVLATPAEQAAWAWVVTRHEIDYRRPARLGDALVAETWVGRAAHSLFERHTEILLAADRKVAARALTLWCPIDPATGRPKQVSAEIRARFSVSAP
jgi:acyl-CoA thioester hydrolase